MSRWPSSKARKVLGALHRIGWSIKPSFKKGSSHIQLQRKDYKDYTWAFHDYDEIGPVMLSKIAKHTGLTPEDL